MGNEIDFFIRFDKIKRQIVEIDWGKLEVEELNEFSYKVALTDHEQDDDHHHGLIFTMKEDGFTLSNDLFCTIPVYFFRRRRLFIYLFGF
ncbi:hypothetical protein D8T47_21175 [Vibrio vulnificus]|nr:hypothetical protein D8T47_21175 [Vibrio vulnificus]